MFMGCRRNYLFFALLLFGGVCFANESADRQVQAVARAPIEAIFQGDEAGLELIWLRPLEETWKRFETNQIQGEPKTKLLKLIREAKFEKWGGAYYLIDYPHHQADKGGQGYLLLKRGSSVVAFHFQASMENKRALGVREVIQSEGQWRFGMKREVGFGGFILDGDFRSLLGRPLPKE